MPTLVHTAIVLMKQSATCLADVELMQAALDEIMAAVQPSGLAVSAHGNLVAEKKPKTREQGLRELANKKRWTVDDTRRALAQFKPQSLPPNLTNFLRSKQLI